MYKETIIRDIFIPRNFRHFSKIYFLFAFIIMIFAIGIVGFMVIEKFRLVDAVYMTVITVATVGFGEVHPLSQSGKIFTSILIVFSFGTFAYAISTITSYVADGNFRRHFGIYKTHTTIRKMKDHVIICGYGRNGKQAAIELMKHKHPFVIVDTDPNIYKNFSEKDAFQILLIEGNATDDDVLLRAGISSARALITTLPKDADNLYVVLSAKAINPKITIVSRASEDSSVKKLRIAGADNIIMPDKIGGAQMATLILKPDVVEFLDYILVQDNFHSNLVEITCNDLPEVFRNKTIRELNIRGKTGANIIGYKTPDGEHVINPAPDTKLIENSKLFVLGVPEEIAKLKEIVKIGLI